MESVSRRESKHISTTGNYDLRATTPCGCTHMPRQLVLGQERLATSSSEGQAPAHISASGCRELSALSDFVNKHQIPVTLEALNMMHPDTTQNDT